MSDNAGSGWIDARTEKVQVYDPGLGSIASCKSSITYLDGENGVLRYRGYPIEEIAGRVSFLDTCFLVLYGELPSAAESVAFANEIATEAADCPRELLDTLPVLLADAKPMAFLQAATASLAASDHSVRRAGDGDAYRQVATRLIACLPLLAAAHARARSGFDRIGELDGFSYVEKFLTARFGVAEDASVAALDLLFVLHADHEQNCSTTAARVAASAHADPYHAVASAIGALAGPLHGGANEEVLIQLAEIGDPANVDSAVQAAKDGSRRLMGFGHRVYKNYDPRATIIREAAHSVLESSGTSDPLLEVAMRLEKAALSDEYFIARKLYPNVDFYSGLIYRALGFNTDEFTVLFALGRCVGWLAHCAEQLDDPEQRIIRPRQIYTGRDQRSV